METKKKSIESLMTEKRTFPPSEEARSRAHISDPKEYEKMWRMSIDQPDEFWLEQAKSLSWFKEPTETLDYVWDTANRRIEHTWFADGTLNVSYNCLDRHLGTPIENKTAILWQGEAEDAVQQITYENCTTRSASSPTCSKPTASRRATASPSTCRMVPELASRHAGLHPHRRHSLRDLRRLQRRRHSRPHQRLRLQDAHHRQRLHCVPASTST